MGTTNSIKFTQTFMQEGRITEFCNVVPPVTLVYLKVPSSE